MFSQSPAAKRIFQDENSVSKSSAAKRRRSILKGTIHNDALAQLTGPNSSTPAVGLKSAFKSDRASRRVSFAPRNSMLIFEADEDTGKISPSTSFGVHADVEPIAQAEAPIQPELAAAPVEEIKKTVEPAQHRRPRQSMTFNLKAPLLEDDSDEEQDMEMTAVSSSLPEMTAAESVASQDITQGSASAVASLLGLSDKAQNDEAQEEDMEFTATGGAFAEMTQSTAGAISSLMGLAAQEEEKEAEEEADMEFTATGGAFAEMTQSTAGAISSLMGLAAPQEEEKEAEEEEADMEFTATGGAFAEMTQSTAGAISSLMGLAAPKEEEKETEEEEADMEFTAVGGALAEMTESTAGAISSLMGLAAPQEKEEAHEEADMEFTAVGGAFAEMTQSTAGAISSLMGLAAPKEEEKETEEEEADMEFTAVGGALAEMTQSTAGAISSLMGLAAPQEKEEAHEEADMEFTAVAPISIVSQPDSTPAMPEEEADMELTSITAVNVFKSEENIATPVTHLQESIDMELTAVAPLNLEPEAPSWHDDDAMEVDSEVPEPIVDSVQALDQAPVNVQESVASAVEKTSTISMTPAKESTGTIASRLRKSFSFATILAAPSTPAASSRYYSAETPAIAETAVPRFVLSDPKTEPTVQTETAAATPVAVPDPTVQSFMTAANVVFYDRIANSRRRDTVLPAPPVKSLAEFGRIDFVVSPELNLLESACKTLEEESSLKRTAAGELESQIDASHPDWLGMFDDATDEDRVEFQAVLKHLKYAAQLDARSRWYDWRADKLSTLRDSLSQTASVIDAELAEYARVSAEMDSLAQALPSYERSLRKAVADYGVKDAVGRDIRCISHFFTTAVESSAADDTAAVLDAAKDVSVTFFSFRKQMRFKVVFGVDLRDLEEVGLTASVEVEYGNARVIKEGVQRVLDETPAGRMRMTRICDQVNRAMTCW